MGTPIAPRPITPTTSPTAATLLRSERPEAPYTRSRALRLRRPPRRRPTGSPGASSQSRPERQTGPHLHFDLPGTFPNTLSSHEHSRRGSGAASSAAPPASASPRRDRFLFRDDAALV